MRAQIVIMALAVAFAGCSGGGKTADAPPSTSAPPATVTSEFGSIEGLVVTDEQVPIEGAEVGLEGGRQAQSDASGKFVFNDLPGGKYKLAVGKLGYEAVARNVDVVAGEVTKVPIVLRALAVADEIFIQRFIFEGYLHCSVNTNYATNPCEPVTGANRDRYVFELVNGTATGGVFELAWTPTNGVTGQQLEFDFCRIPDADPVDERFLCQGTIGDFYHYKTGSSPLIFDVDKESDPPFPHKQYKKYMIGAGAGLLEAPAYQQPFTIYGAICFHADCPEDFTQLPPTS